MKALCGVPKPYQLMPLRWSSLLSIHSLPLWLENRGLGSLGGSSFVGSSSDRRALDPASAVGTSGVTKGTIAEAKEGSLMGGVR